MAHKTGRDGAFVFGRNERPYRRPIASVLFSPFFFAPL